MLSEKNISFKYREYTEDPLSRAELAILFEKLDITPQNMLRKSDKAYKENNLTGAEESDYLLDLMAENPTLLQRPIGVLGSKAVSGRPIENLLEL